MDNQLNHHGDKLIATTGRHGADIAVQRMDELDSAALAHGLGLPHKGAALDIGCGAGIQGLRLACIGFRTTLVDMLPQERTVLRAQALKEFLPISYLRRDARALTLEDLPADICLCYSQRFIHYLRFQEAVELLGLVRQRMVAGAKLFISASGLNSELGEGYEGKRVRISERFARLSLAMAEKHGIQAPVCLYTAQELVMLCEMAAYRCDEVYASPFGNVKGIFTAL